MQTKILHDRDAATLSNICRVAAERFAEHAANLRAPVSDKTEPFLNPDAANRIAEQFDRQAQEALAFASTFDNCEQISIQYDDAEAET